MKKSQNIQQVFKKFLKDQKERLSDRTYSDYDSAIFLFESFLDSYGYNSLDGEDHELFEKMYNKEDKEFCEIFGPEKIDSSMVDEFLSYFLIKKVAMGKDFKRAAGRVIKKLFKWLGENKYIVDEAKLADLVEVAKRRKNDVYDAENLSEMLTDLIEYTDDDILADRFEKVLEGYFEFVKVEPGKLWLCEMGTTEELGPIKVSQDISSLVKVGWTMSGSVGKTKKDVMILSTWNVYP